MARILIIDDDEAIRYMLLETLSASGHNVVATTNGLEGLEYFRANAIDLIITDLMMPYGGLAAIRMIRDESPNVAIIAMSGGGAFRLDYARGIGAHATLPKPFTIHELMTAISQELPVEPGV
jgi:two-component system, OmpR family, response regulator SaeR